MWARARSTEVVIMDYSDLENEITAYHYPVDIEDEKCECPW